jgi:hypothetical protein
MTVEKSPFHLSTPLLSEEKAQSCDVACFQHLATCRSATTSTNDDPDDPFQPLCCPNCFTERIRIFPADKSTTRCSRIQPETTKAARTWVSVNV